MQLNLWRGAQGVILAAVLLFASFAVHLQPALAQSDQEQADADAALDAEIQRAHHSFDQLARTFTKKKRSELINLKSYTDAEWAQLERDVKTNNAACRKGDAEACLAAGQAYETGDGVWIVPDIAYILYNDACDAGLSDGCLAFVDLANSGHGYPDESYKPLNWYLEKSCDLGDAYGCVIFANELRLGSPEERARGDALLEATCKDGSATACVALGEALIATEKPEAAQKAAAILDATCRKLDAEACRLMASGLERGRNPDLSQSSEYRHFACYGGSAFDCLEMGKRAWRGSGMAADESLALRYIGEACRLEPLNCELPRQLAALPGLRAACEKQDAQACAGLGTALYAYDSPVYDRVKGASLLQASCRSGVVTVCALAASSISRRDPDAAAGAAALLETGCKGDDSASCFALARAIEAEGPVRIEEAVTLYRRLCDARYPDACKAEERYVGFVEAARIRPASTNFTPPLESDEPDAVLRATENLEVCFTGSERFRGKTYVQFNCDRSEKGINSERAQPGQAPWQALLWRPETMFDTKLTPGQRVLCGGSLIAQSWVLTAAHCLNDDGFDLADPKVRSGYRIRLGVYNPGADEGISYPILRVIRHPQFDFDNKLAFDVALIQYDTRAPTVDEARAYKNPIHTIAVDSQPVGARKITAGMTAYAFGWGWTAEQRSTATDYLQIMKLGVSTEAACTALTGFTKALSNAALCAKGKAGTQTCYGDSGGPLVYYGDRAGRPVLIGVVSAGAKCGTTKSNRPSQYTRVAKVRDWIATYVPGIK